MSLPAGLCEFLQVYDFSRPLKLGAMSTNRHKNGKLAKALFSEFYENEQLICSCVLMMNE